MSRSDAGCTVNSSLEQCHLRVVVGSAHSAGPGSLQLTLPSRPTRPGRPLADAVKVCSGIMSGLATGGGVVSAWVCVGVRDITTLVVKVKETFNQDLHVQLKCPYHQDHNAVLCQQ